LFLPAALLGSDRAQATPVWDDLNRRVCVEIVGGVSHLA
jgi:hypothetical protein